MIFNIGGAAFKLPVLNASYPQNVTLVQSASASATFQIEIVQAGEPAEYTYQWYVNDEPVAGATGTSYTKTGLSSVATYAVYCKVTHVLGEVLSRTAILTVQSYLPTYTYNGSHKLVNEGNGNWYIYMYTSGTFNASNWGSAKSTGIDVFCLGGGGNGAPGDKTYGGSGGAGGKTTTKRGVSVSENNPYGVTVGGSGGTTSAFGVSASGGGSGALRGPGGSGGSGGGSGGRNKGGGDGGTNGGNGETTEYAGGTGQGTNTYEFGETSRTLYAGGGGGGAGENDSPGQGGAGGGVQGGWRGYDGFAASANTGGGGGGGGAANGGNGHPGGAGGSGIVVIRNKR